MCLSICMINERSKEDAMKVVKRMGSFYVELKDQSLDFASVMDQYLSNLATREGSIEVHPELDRTVRVWLYGDLIFLDFDEWARRRDGDGFVLISGVGVVDHLLDEFIVSNTDIVVVLHVLHKI